MVTEYHPECDESELLSYDTIKVYQMMIGCSQWAVTLGRYDIQYATNILACYAVAPRKGHFKAVTKIFGYLKHHKKHRLLLSPKIPNYTDLEFQDYDWTHYYKDAVQELPSDMLTPHLRTESSNFPKFGFNSIKQLYNFLINKLKVNIFFEFDHS